MPLHLYEYMHTLALTSDGSSPINGHPTTAISKVSGVLKFASCPGTSYVWSRGQILIFVKRHCTGVNLVEEG